MPSCWKLTWCFCSDPVRPKISSPVHLLLKPPDAELLGHAFKQKQFRRSRPCNLCHQPVKNYGSSCRVCKYTCHKTCEPKVWRACRHGNPSLKNGSEPLMSRPSSGARQATIVSPSRRMDPTSYGGSSSAMDLSFVTERILALSFPPEMDAPTYREALHQAASMLQTKHGDNYMVFNLSLPRKEIALWNPRVLDVGWPDQLAPPLERLCSVCRALDSWLQADPQHVAVLHSKCGLQRVGVVVAAYCEYTGLCPPNQQDQQSLDRFSMKRFLNERVGGLRTPSDKRYVEYFAGLLSGAIQVNSSPLFLDHVTVVGIPAFQSNGGCRAFFKVYQGSVPVHTSAIYNLHDSARHFTMSLGERGLALRGDILVKCYHRHRQPVDGRETIFSLQFHTCAVTQHTLVFQRQDLDDACQDLRFPLDGSVRLHFSNSPESRLMGVNETHTRYTVESSAGDPVVRWDSYDTVTDSASCADDHHHDVSSSPGSTQNAHHHRLAHTYGPLDGSLYAKVLKQSSKTPPSSPPLVVSTAVGERSTSRFSDPSSSTSGADYHHLHHHHHHHPVQFLNSPHVASTDSGISSAGVVRSGGGSSTHNRDLGGSGSASASPPHSGRSAESSGAGVFDPPPTPSPVQQQLHQQLQQQSPSATILQATPLQRMPSIVETRAEIHRDGRDVMMMGTSTPPSSLTATAELDQLLSGMLMNVQNIPDIRPEHRHFQRGDDIDVDSIQVNFDLTPSSRDTTDHSTPVRKNSSINSQHCSSPSYVYESDTVRRAYPGAQSSGAPTTSTPLAKMPVGGPTPLTPSSLLHSQQQQHQQHQQQQQQQQPSVRAKDIPYHAREDSKPFTYGVLTNGHHAHHHPQENGNGSVGAGSAANGSGASPSTPTSPSIHRRNWKESSSNGQGQVGKRLESPSLVRKFSSESEPVVSAARSAPRIPVPSIADPASPRPMRKLSESLLNGAIASSSVTDNNPSTSVSNLLPVATSSPRLDSSRNRSASSASASEMMKTPPQLQHHISLEETIQDISTSPDSSRMSSSDVTGLSWLQRQQQKLRERKDSMRRAERHPQEARLLSELRSSHQFRGQQQLQHQQSSTSTGRPVDDAGYLSDVTLFSELDMVNTSREGSPDIRSLYATPLHINTAGTYGQYQQSKAGQTGSGVNKTLSSSNPASPLLTHRSSSLERSGRYVSGGGGSHIQQQQQQRLTLTRQKSDMSHDRERPFAAVKRAHEQHIKSLNSSNGGQDSVMSWNSSLSGDLDTSGNRPTTPAFPVVPRTPYLNVHHHHHQGFGRQSIDSPVTPTSSHSGAGLPPKSPTTQRRYPAGLQQVNSQPYSPTPPSAKILRKWPSNSSVSSKERSPSPSPSSAYLGHSRRSSIQSAGGLSEPQEVSSVHVNFVMDNSRYWYKPNIAREDAINLLKDQPPGTFIVRDSNSFPGAFGLALKVATPPPHVAGKNNSDPSVELVRHFLIEPTSKGVRIKGCSNEPVFGSLSALIYQHSVTPLALPIKLVLPESDLILKDGTTLPSQSPASPTTQLLTQGAACSLLYLFTMDTESLTGPQAIQRTMTHLLDSKPLPTPTVVHFKVSSQGITLTDNERKLFFRRHYPVTTVSYCGLDPEDRRWNQRSEETGLPISSNRCFGFIARKPASKTDNQCHIFAELEAEQPATAIVNFVTKVMMTSSSSHSKNNV